MEVSKSVLFRFAERRRRWSDSYKGLPLSDDEDETDSKEKAKAAEDARLKVR